MPTPYRVRAPRTAPAAAGDALGPHRRTYRDAAPRNVVWAAVPFVMLLAYGVWLAHQGMLQQWFNSTFSVLAVAALFVLSVARIVHTSVAGGAEAIRVHDGGIVDLRAEPRSVQWDEVQSLTAVCGSGDGVDRHVLRTTDGATLTLGPAIGQVHDLVDEVRARILDHKLPSARARLLDGGVVRFGVLGADPRGAAGGAQCVSSRGARGGEKGRVGRARRGSDQQRVL